MGLSNDVQPYLTAIVWIGAIQAAWFALVLPEQRRRRWRDGRLTVAELKVVGHTMLGSDAVGRGIYQAHGTLHTDSGDHPTRSVNRLVGYRPDLIGQTVDCLYDPEMPSLVELGPRRAVIASPQGIALAVFLLALMVWSAWPYLNTLLG